MKKRDIYKIIFLIIFWELCAIFITFYDATILGFRSEINGKSTNFWITLSVAVSVCLIGSTLLGSLEVLLLGKLLRKKPLGFNLVIKTSVYICFIFFFTSLATIYIYSLEIGQSLLSKDVLNYYVIIFLNYRIAATLLYWGIACMLALFFLQVNEKFGQGVLKNFLLGKYHKPKEDKRIFMFMDLKSSTTYAEKLGHINYSKFIQDCFYDLTDIILSYEANVYQYVGDEVVLTWDIDKGIKQGNCIKTFFSYDKLLNSKRTYYMNKYGVVPEFKASINLGIIMIAEVGEIKRELAYHGDVLNTAARIQSMCNKFKKKLLVSEQLKAHFEKQSSYEFESLGDINLKGKEESVNIYAVNSA